MHVVHRFLPAVLMAAGLVLALAPDTRATALAARCCGLAPLASDVERQAEPLTEMLAVALNDLLVAVARKVDEHSPMTGSNGAPATPILSGQGFCHSCLDGMGRPMSPEVPELLSFDESNRAALVLPVEAALFLAGTLAGTLAGLALASMVVGLSGPDTERTCVQGEVRGA